MKFVTYKTKIIAQHCKSASASRGLRPHKIPTGTLPLDPTDPGWRRGVVVSGVRRMNEVYARRARLLFGRVTVFGRVCHIGM